eukprot:scaffold144931_cov105-Phaeocystis_antarctica.AAC.1
MGIGSKPTLALPVSPKPTLLATPTPAQPDIFPMHEPSALVPHGGSIHVEENVLGLVAAEVVVAAQKFQSFLQYNSSDCSDSCSVSSDSPPSVMAVAQQLVPS